MSLAPLLSSARQDWCTPAALLDRVRQVGRIGLDPCASPQGLVHARVEWTGPPEGENGLAASWAPVLKRGEIAWCNPPFAELATWVDKAVSEWTRLLMGLPDEDAFPSRGILLLSPARTDTAWFRRLVENARAICFLSGRLTFVGAPNPAPFPSSVACFGGPAMVGRFREAFAGAGWLR